MTTLQNEIFREKLKKGLDLSYKRLVSQIKKAKGELVVSKDKKVIHIKASEL